MGDRIQRCPAELCVCVCVVTQSCPTICDPVDCSPPGSTVYGILQARILEWAVMGDDGKSIIPVLSTA